MNQKISVIIPAYNATAYVTDAINSVLIQKYTPIEIILVDDGSTDGTADLVRSQAPEVLIIQQENAGVAAARNTGLREATGNFICFLDADDGWFPGKLKAQIEYLQRHPETGLLYHDWLVWKPDADGIYRLPLQSTKESNSEQIDPLKSGWVYPQLLLCCIIHTSAVMLRRTIAEQVGYFDTTLINGEDYNYWLRVSRLCKIHKLTGMYSFYRTAPNSLTSRPKNINYESFVLERALREWGVTSPDGRRVDPVLLQQRLYQLSMSFGYAHFHVGSAALASP